jgi:methyl-accepting chemotaxis protein
LRRGFLAAAALLPLAHAALLFTPGPLAPKAALTLGTDLVGIALLALYASRRGGAAKGREAASGAPPPPAPPVPAPAEAAASLQDSILFSVDEAKPSVSPLEEISALAEGCLASCGLIFEEDARLKGAGPTVAELSAALAAARQSADLIHENTDKIFEIANNLANSAEQAFNLSHEVEARASAMAGELGASLAETDGLLAESKRISDILTIMSEISSTTSILSFNASIVAANAGAHGKPFAVVAKEMRKLSEGTEASLKDITTIVHTIQEKVRKVSEKIRSINDGVKDEKESLVAVAGDLQGVMLANEVIRTVSGLCVQKSSEELESFRSMEGKLDSALRALRAGAAPERMADFSSGLRKLAELAAKRD